MSESERKNDVSVVSNSNNEKKESGKNSVIEKEKVLEKEKVIEKDDIIEEDQ